MASPAPGARRSFVVQVNADGATTVEDVLTQERVGVASIAEVPSRIAAWLPPEEGRAEAGPPGPQA